MCGGDFCREENLFHHSTLRVFFAVAGEVTTLGNLTPCMCVFANIIVYGEREGYEARQSSTQTGPDRNPNPNLRLLFIIRDRQ